jgi:hypothetical protein
MDFAATESVFRSVDFPPMYKRQGRKKIAREQDRRRGRIARELNKRLRRHSLGGQLPLATVHLAADVQR